MTGGANAGIPVLRPHAPPRRPHEVNVDLFETSRIRPDFDLAEVDWFVVYCQPKAEGQAARALTRAGLFPYRPLAQVSRYVRRRYSPKPALVTTMRPAFVRYLFVGVPIGRWFNLQTIPGAVSVVSFDGRPIRVPAATIEDIIVAEDMGLFDVGPREQQVVRIEIGQTVRIVHGPLEGYHATVEAVPRKRGAPAVVSVNGRTISAPIDQIRVVA